MSNYVKSTNFTSKDSLPLGDPLKIVKGTEIDAEFNNIATAVATKADLASPTFTGVPAAPTASPGTDTTQVATTAFVGAAVTAATSTLGTLSTQDANNVAITGGAISGITDLAIADGGTGASDAATAFANLKQAATETATGVVELATNAEAQAGTDTSRAITPASMKAGFNASGSAPVYACRAWVVFDGTTSPATIIASGNVTSVTRNSTGNYTVNLTTALQDSNYSVVATAGGTGRNTIAVTDVDSSGSLVSRTSSSFYVHTCRASDVTAVNPPYVHVSVFR